MLPEIPQGEDTKVFYHKRKRTFRLQRKTDPVLPPNTDLEVTPVPEPSAVDQNALTVKVKYPEDFDSDIEPGCAEEIDDDSQLASAHKSGDTIFPGQPANENGEIECFAVDKKLNEPVRVGETNATLIKRLKKSMGGLVADTKKTFGQVVDTVSQNLKSA